MDPWNCCRACLSGLESLYPIFQQTGHHEKYSEVIFSATGLKVIFNDALPQEMCKACINFINITYQFRKKCEENHKTLLSHLNERQKCNIKIEPNTFNTENGINIGIDISSVNVDCNTYNGNQDRVNDFDYDSVDNDNKEIVLETRVQDIIDKPIDIIFKKEKESNNSDPVENNDNNIVETEFETRVQDIVDKPVEIIFKNNKKVKKVSEKPARRSLRKKTEKGAKKEREKEEIECEYCHKILTSKLSLRNHYKIHTGFDVICEHCGKKFITRRLLLMHCRAKHGYEKTDKCSFCDYKASNAEQVKIHERIHTGEKPYACSVCGVGFHRKSSYLQHVAIHLPDKTVQCDQCPARFKSVTLMRIHKNRHKAPQYSFKCLLCLSNFSRRRNVARHLQRIHALTSAPQHIHRIKIG